MSKSLQRRDNRAFDQLRSITMTPGIFEYSPGSLLFELGKTKILCSVTLQQGVPSFLRGKKTGWLTAEYAMLPASTTVRSTRESSTVRRNGRSVEISRLIGRSLRSSVDLTVLGERTVIVDCDVLQADGGTRTAAITAAGYALKMAERVWLAKKLITGPCIIEDVAAVSVGFSHGHALLDLDFHEDKSIHADFNIVGTRSGNLIELQGCSEAAPLAWDGFEKIRQVAVKGLQDLFVTCDAEYQKKKSQVALSTAKSKKPLKAPLFSLQSRLAAVVQK